MEYELKFLGHPADLRSAYRNFMNAAESLRDRHYSFNTYYLDSSGRMHSSGYSIRHRVGQLEINSPPNTEIKALEGETQGVSARLEIGENGPDPMKNYFNLMARDEYPKPAPKLAPQNLRITFATAARRSERRALVELCGKPWIIEAALDDIAYLWNEGDTGPDLYDCVLFPCGQEHELEMELKPVNPRQRVTEEVLGQFRAWVAGNVVAESGKLTPTTQSKALRGMSAGLRYAAA